MRVILFGATGMVGQGVLRECVLDPGVDAVLSVVRHPSGEPLPAKVRELVPASFYDFSALQPEFAGYDACFFCLGISSVGMKELEYRRITYDITMAAAQVLVMASPKMTFSYVSGSGTDANGRSMWARVKGETENALMAMSFRAAYMFRPGAILPLDGSRSKTAVYRVAIAFLKPIFPFLVRRFPQFATTTRQVGRAMLTVARSGYPKAILEPRDIAAA